jgi:multidrug resistance efflux pump
MAVARDQAARVVRQQPEAAEGEAAGAQLADQLRTHVAEEIRRRPADAPGAVPTDKPAAPPADAAKDAAKAAAPKSGKKKFVMMGVVGLLAVAAVSYGVYYALVGRFYVSTDDAYVRANNTTLGARVAGHVAAIFPGDNSIVRTGDVIFKIDDGDYRIAVDAARDNVEVTKAQQNEARAQLAELQTSLAKAERDLDFTSVRAPVDGTFSNRLVNTGDFIQAGQRLGNVVPLNDVFIDANFKETQLKRIRPGQPVTISVDAYGHRKFAAVVDSISPAAGSVFTLLPPDNATGNFTKIVQRLPVRIRVPKDVAKQNLLRAGMSVYTTVNTSDGAADAENEADLDASPMLHPK